QVAMYLIHRLKLSPRALFAPIAWPAHVGAPRGPDTVAFSQCSMGSRPDPRFPGRSTRDTPSARLLSAVLPAAPPSHAPRPATSRAGPPTPRSTRTVLPVPPTP